ncbi:MAG: D-alanyl-D-alanine carboxypeptidase family protein [Gammaproteobacteria bacterium]
MVLTHLRRSLLSLVSFLLCLFSGALAGAPLLTPSPPAIDAGAHILMDYHSGRVLAESNADERMEPASLTKLMTVYVVFSELKEGNIQLDDLVRVSEKAWRTSGSRMFVEVDKQVSVEELLKGVIIQSGNDASVALAEFVAGDEVAFSQLMNHHAQALGMRNTNFVNATGLPDPNEYTTAHDLSLLARALIRNFPKYYEWHSVRKYDYNGITQYNRNKLLWRDNSVDGLKTGHTNSAGYCLVASAKRDGMRLISVVLGAQSEKTRAQDSQALLNYGFRFFETHRLYQAQEPLVKVRVWEGAVPQVEVGLDDDLYITVPRGQYDQLKGNMQLEAAIKAPIEKRQTLGKALINLGEEQIAERPLVSLQTVAEGSLWQRLTDQVRLYFQ